MLRRRVVAVNGYSPTLVPAKLVIAVQGTHNGGELGTEQEDVDAAKDGRLVQEVCHRLLEDTLGEVGNQMPIHDNRGAALFKAEVLATDVVKTRCS